MGWNPFASQPNKDAEWLRGFSNRVREETRKAQEADRRHTFARLLGGDEDSLRQINFSVEEGGQEVAFNLGEYTKIASLIADGRISMSTVVPGGTIAAYDMRHDEIFFASTAAHSVRDRASLLHEMSHAVIDVHKADRWSAATNESAAYLAETVFLMIKGQPVLTQEVQGDPLAVAVYTKAQRIASVTGLKSGNSVPKVNGNAEWGGFRDAVKAYYQATGAWLDKDLKSRDGEHNAGADGLRR